MIKIFKIIVINNNMTTKQIHAKIDKYIKCKDISNIIIGYLKCSTNDEIFNDTNIWDLFYVSSDESLINIMRDYEIIESEYLYPRVYVFGCRNLRQKHYWIYIFTNKSDRWEYTICKPFRRSPYGKHIKNSEYSRLFKKF